MALGEWPARGGANRAHWRGRRGAGTRRQWPGVPSGAGEERGLWVSAAAMATVDLEKLRMSGAGKAIGVLTSGGDAQGE